VSLKACSDNEAEVGSAVEMRCHNTICANRVSPIQLVLIINTSLSNRYLFIELRVHAATHVHAHTHHIHHYWSHKGDRELLTVSHSRASHVSSGAVISVLPGAAVMFQQALAFICLRVAHCWWISLTRR